MNAKVRVALLTMVLAGVGGYYYWSGKAKTVFSGNPAVAHAPDNQQSSTSVKLGLDISNERGDIATEVAELIKNREYAKLEEMSKRFREEDERTVEGWSKLTSFYDGTTLGLREIEQYNGLEEVNNRLDEWKKAHPDSLTEILARSRYLIKAAWAARGDGLANTVRPEQWEVFFDLLKQSRLALAEAEKITDQFDPYSLVIQLILGRATDATIEEMAQIVATGVEKYPTYEGTYREMSTALMPRWGGRLGDMESFAEHVQKHLPEPLGDIMYARIVGNILNYERNTFFENTIFPYEKVRDSYLTLIDEYPNGVANKMVLVRFAVMKQDATLARRLFEEIGPWPASEVQYVWGSAERYGELLAWATGEGDNPQEVTPLEFAVTTADADAVTSAIANGGDVNKLSSKGVPLISVALQAGEKEIATILAESGADLTAKSRKNVLVVTTAVRGEHLDILDKAIEQTGMGINDHVTPNGWTLLHVAAYYNHPKTAEHLIVQYKADVEARTNDGATPILLGAEKNSVETAELLLKHGANVDNGDDKNITPLHYGAWAGSAEVVKLLLEAGADPKITSKSGVDALTAAKAQHQAETTKLLEEALAK